MNRRIPTLETERCLLRELTLQDLDRIHAVLNRAFGWEQPLAERQRWLQWTVLGYALVREHYGVLNTAILNQHGAIVKTIGDAIMANFTHPHQAVGAALEMLSGIRQLNQSSRHAGLILKIGIHNGAAISVTLNNRIDYFGTTVNIASRVQGSAGGDQIYLTEEVYNSAGVIELLQKQGCQIESTMLDLRGIQEQVKIYIVTGSNKTH